MKRVFYIVALSVFLVLSVLSLNAVSAISTSINDSYSPGETAITAISGNILEPIESGNVILTKKGHIPVPFDYEIRKLGENYYLWFITPQQADNYTLSIRNITTTIAGKVDKIDYEKNFSLSGSLSDYSVKPGLISTEKDFQIKVQLNEDNNKEIYLNFIEEANTTLKPGENILKFSISDVNESGLFNLTIGKYNLPVFVVVEKTSSLPEINTSERLNLTELKGKELTEEALKQEELKYHCYEFPGITCNADEKCSGETIISLDGECCVNGGCQPKDESSWSSAWIGYLIAAILIIAGVFIWMRYKRVKTDKNLPIEKSLLNNKKMP